MVKKDIRDRIFKALTPLLMQNGFVASKGKSCYIKKLDKGFQKIGVSIVDFPFRKKYEIEFILGVRFDEVEDLMQQVQYVVEKYRKDSISVQANFTELTQSDDKITVLNENEVDNMINDFSKFCIHEGLAYLDSISTIQKIDEILNHPDYDIVKSPFVLFNWHLLKIVVAKLNKNPRYNDIIKDIYVYMDTVNMNQHAVEQFIEMDKILKELK